MRVYRNVKKSLLVFNFLILVAGFFIINNVVFAESDFCTYDRLPVIFNYAITNGQLHSMCLDRDVNNVILKIDAKQDGNLIIDIPRKAVNAVVTCERDDNFFVLIDGEEVNYVETKTTDKFRRLTILFSHNSQEIEIIGTNTGTYPASCAHLYENDRISITPLQQIKLGVKPHDVICEDGLKLVFKSTDFSSVCIKHSSVGKFIERDWIMHGEHVIFQTEKTEYKIGEPITVTMINVGTVDLRTLSVPTGFSVYDSDDNRICSWIGVNEGEGKFRSSDSVTYTWEQNKCPEGKQEIESGIYIFKADHFNNQDLAILSITIMDE